jgi:hypothetical protein
MMHGSTSFLRDFSALHLEQHIHGGLPVLKDSSQFPPAAIPGHGESLEVKPVAPASSAQTARHRNRSLWKIRI